MRRTAFIVASVLLFASCKKDSEGNSMPPVNNKEGTYYIDNVNGDNNNTGESPEKAWKTITNINRLTFQPGDKILLKAGGVWDGVIAPEGKGEKDNPIVIDMYGEGEKPLLNGNGRHPFTVRLQDIEYFELKNLRITNKGEERAEKGVLRVGVHIIAEDMGEVNHIHLKGLEIYDVNGFYGVSGDDFNAGKENGGILIEIKGSEKPTYFNGLVVEDCHIHNVEQSGMTNKSSWSSRTFTDDGDWTPSLNVVIRGNRFEKIGGNGLILRVAKSPLIENNLFDSCGLFTTGNASFSFNTDDALWQYNEARFTHNTGEDVDAGGFDSDYRSKGTIFQYNYSHDNEHGGILITGGPSNLTTAPFNDGTIVRYNVFANNKAHIVRTSGLATNTLIHNNVFYTDATLEDKMDLGMVYHKSWSGTSDNTEYYNNIFYSEVACDLFNNEGNSTNNTFDNNIFYYKNGGGTNIPTTGNNNIQEDPLFSFGFGLEGAFRFQLNEGSPAIDAGKEIPDNVLKDYAGNTVPVDVIDIGAFEKKKQ